VSEVVRLGQLACLITKGTTPKTVGRAYLASGIPFLRSEDIQGSIIDWKNVSLHIDGETHQILGRSQLCPGDLLITIAGTIGRVGFIGADAPPMNCNQAVALIRIDRADVDVRYLCYALQAESVARQFGKQKTTATISNVSLQQIRDLKLRLPTLAEQRRIVDILDRAASIRRLRQQAQDTGRLIIPALFNKMFGDPATNPMGWPRAPLGDVIAGFEGGRNLQADAEDAANGSLKILKVSAVTSGIFRPEEAKPAPKGYVPPPNHFVRDGDLIISRANTAELVGATALVRDPPGNLLLPDKIWRISFKQESLVQAEFLLAWFKQPGIRDAISALATGTSASMRNISQGRLSTIPIILPPPQMQSTFAESAIALQSAMEFQGRSSGVAELISAGLQARLLG
jgi:type I restriction enzyme S subunit